MNHKNAFFNIMKLLLITAFMTLASATSGSEGEKEDTRMTSIYDFNAVNIDGNDVNLADYKGKVLLIVNVASKCGFTPQYEGLQKLYSEYKDRGFEILAFPANDFMGQEPGTNEQIKTFCRVNYQVSFPLFSKISVKGENIHPLYKYLTDKNTNPKFAGKITWNFNKFLIDRKGNIVNRFDSKIKPRSPEVIQAIEKALQEKQ